MNYRFLNSITDDEVNVFRSRLAETLKAQVAADGTRLMSDAEVQRELDKLSMGNARVLLQANDAEHYDYEALAKSISASYRDYTATDISQRRKEMSDLYLKMAEHYGWDMKESKTETKTYFYDDLTDADVLAMLRENQSAKDYVEYISIYG